MYLEDFSYQKLSIINDRLMIRGLYPIGAKDCLVKKGKGFGTRGTAMREHGDNARPMAINTCG
jgi:hypothetical protein